MGTLRDHQVICPKCAARFTAGLVNAVNISRFPHMKDQILKRTFNRAKCPTCGTVSAIEKHFMYTDTAASLAIVVHPRKERHLHAPAVKEARQVVTPLAQGGMLRADNVRVVFGLEELREKIVASDHGYSDQLVELMKLYVIHEHPFLTQKRRMRITLDSIDAEKVTFNCTFDHDPQTFQVYVPIAFLDVLAQRLATPKTLQKPFAAVAQSFKVGSEAGWVNLWSLNASNDALAMLRRYAGDITAGRPVDLDSAAFKKMVKTLPKGAQLASSAKRDLFTLEQYARAKKRGDVEDDLFEVRFGIDLDDDWSRNADRDDIRVLWTLLKNLPDIAVEGSTWIETIKLDSIDYGGTYWEKEIVISSSLTSGSADFRSTILHEVGHSVQDKLDHQGDVVTKWLEKQFGWRRYALTTTGIDQWVAAMGGYPVGTPEGTKAQVRSYIQQSTGDETMDRPVILNGPSGHLWNDPAFGPRAAFNKTRSSWWETNQGWHAANGHRFFVNHYYNELMSLNEAAIALLPSMPSDYAAMSPFEFFAEMFAWFFDDKALKRSAIPQPVAQWFQSTIGSLDVAAPAPPVARGRAAFPLLQAPQARTAGKRIISMPPISSRDMGRPPPKQRAKGRGRAGARS